MKRELGTGTWVQASGNARWTKVLAAGIETSVTRTHSVVERERTSTHRLFKDS